MDVWSVVILPIIVILGSFTLASFITPLAVSLLDKYGGALIRRLFNTFGPIVINQSE